MNMTMSASCSMAPESRRSESMGRLSSRFSLARESCERQSTGTFSGRACKIIETEKEENLLGAKKRTVKQYYVDTEYDFLLTVCKSGSGAGVTLNDVVLWEVSYFTDTPSEKDIYMK